MNKKFHISVCSNSENVHLKLFGVFDDLSACELAELIDRFNGQTNRIFVHTESLDNVLPIGKTVFQQKVVVTNDHLFFTGQHATHFISENKAVAQASYTGAYTNNASEQKQLSGNRKYKGWGDLKNED